MIVLQGFAMRLNLCRSGQARAPRPVAGRAAGAGHSDQTPKAALHMAVRARASLRAPSHCGGCALLDDHRRAREQWIKAAVFAKLLIGARNKVLGHKVLDQLGVGTIVILNQVMEVLLELHPPVRDEVRVHRSKGLLRRQFEERQLWMRLPKCCVEVIKVFVSTGYLVLILLGGDINNVENTRLAGALLLGGPSARNAHPILNPTIGRRSLLPLLQPR